MHCPSRTGSINARGSGPLQLATAAAQGVSAFAASRTFSLIASAGLERTVLLWHPAAPRSLVGSLMGHEAAVTHLSLDDRHSQVRPSGACRALWAAPGLPMRPAGLPGRSCRPARAQLLPGAATAV